jgi:hypothetical protein
VQVGVGVFEKFDDALGTKAFVVQGPPADFGQRDGGTAGLRAAMVRSTVRKELISRLTTDNLLISTLCGDYVTERSRSRNVADLARSSLRKGNHSMKSKARSIPVLTPSFATLSFAALAVLAPAVAAAPSALASSEPDPASVLAPFEAPEPVWAPVPAPDMAEARARVRVTHAWVKGRYLHVHGTVKCKAKYNRGRLILIAMQAAGPHVGHKPLKSPGRTNVRCDGYRHHWDTWHSSRSHEDAKGNWRRGKPVYITGVLVGPKPPLTVSDRVVPR